MARTVLLAEDDDEGGLLGLTCATRAGLSSGCGVCRLDRPGQARGERRHGASGHHWRLTSYSAGGVGSSRNLSQGSDLQAHRHVLHSSVACASVVPLAVLVEAVHLGAVARLCSAVTHECRLGWGRRQGQARPVGHHTATTTPTVLSSRIRQGGECPLSFSPFLFHLSSFLFPLASCFLPQEAVGATYVRWYQ